jgi:hypothetical protein
MAQSCVVEITLRRDVDGVLDAGRGVKLSGRLFIGYGI